MNTILDNFKNKGIFINDIWVLNLYNSGIIDFSQLYEQFLKSSITESCILPKQFIKTKISKENLNFNIVLQIDEIFDISLPLNERKEYKNTPKGSLKLILAIEKYKFIGFEFKKITKLTNLIDPGLKILLKSPIIIRYGVFYLTDNNIEILGGFDPYLIEKRRFIYEDHNKPITNILKPLTNNNTQSQLSSKFLSDSDDVQEIILESINSLKKRSKNIENNILKVNATIFCVLELRSDGNNFVSRCQIKDITGSLEISIDEMLIITFLDCNPAEWILLSENDQQNKALLFEEQLTNLSSPLSLIDEINIKNTQFEYKFIL